jgi:hypothetical protein
MANPKTKTIKITQCCGIEGQIVDVGEVVEVEDFIAQRLIGMGKAEPYEAPAQEEA